MTDHVNDDGEIIDAEPEMLHKTEPAPDRSEPLHKTTSQGKIDATVALLAKAVERASSLALTPEESKALKADFGDECFRGGAAGKENLIYIEHPYLRARLDDVLGMGQAVILPLNRWKEEFKTAKGSVGISVYVEAALIVRGCYVTQAIGSMVYYPGSAAQDFGDAVEGAETAAMRRCAKKFGIGLQAWSKSWCEAWWSRRIASQKAAAQKPVNSPAVDREATLKILVAAAGKGTAALEEAWKAITREQRVACQADLPRFKVIAKQADPPAAPIEREPGIEDEEVAGRKGDGTLSS